MKVGFYWGGGVCGLLAMALLTSAALGTPSTVLPADEAGAAARLTASPRHAEWVTIAGKGTDKFDAWIVYPERSDPAPVVVLVHEIFGLTDWARAVADQYAAEGFIAIAPDFLSGKAPDGKGGSAALGQDLSRTAIAKLDPVEILARLDATAAFATHLPSATKKFGVVGYCWGGGIAFGWATAQPLLGAAVGFYGTAPADAALAGIQAPVLALYGGADARVTSTLAPFRDGMAKRNKRFESEVYEGAGHAFLRQQSGQNGANLTASQKSWPRSVAFLKELLENKTTAMSDAADVPASELAPVDCAGFCLLPIQLAMAQN